MSARLIARGGEIAGRSFSIGRQATLGRGADNTIVLPHELVSGHHGRITFDDEAGCYVLEDLGSRNGTFLAGMRVAEPEKLGRLEVINLAGRFDFIFQQLPEGATASRTRVGEAVPEAPPPDLEAAAREAAGVVGRLTLGGLPPEPLLPPELERAARAAEAPATPPPDVPVAQEGAAGGGGHTLRGELPELAPEAASDLERAALAALGGDPPASPAEGPAARSAEEIEGGPESEERSEEWLVAEEQTPEAEPLPPAAPGAEFVLRVELESGRFLDFELLPGEHTVGRSPACDIPIDNPTLSRAHARLRVAPGEVRIADLGSTNHTFVDDRRVEGEVELRPGVEIGFGAVTARLSRPGDGDPS